MAIRTTAAEVKEIMDNCTLSDTIVDSYITAASALVDYVYEDDSEMPATLLEEVERWYTAHMIAVTTHRTVVSEKLGDASVQYSGQFRAGLNSTPYGQTVLQLDITGRMGDVGKRRARIRSITSHSD